MSLSARTALDLAIDSAAEKHEASEKALGEARRRLGKAQTTYSTLNNFRGEYASRLRGVTRLTTGTLGNFHRFLGKLGQALDSQLNDVNQAGQAVTQSQQAWSATLQRLKAMELLRERRAAAAQLRERRQEQKQSDEYAARSARRLRHCKGHE